MKVMTVSALALLLSTARLLAAPSPSCEAINEADARQFCRATSARDASLCGALSSSQRYRACVAAISGREADCEAVEDKTFRDYCRALAH